MQKCRGWFLILLDYCCCALHFLKSAHCMGARCKITALPGLKRGQQQSRFQKRGLDNPDIIGNTVKEKNTSVEP